MMGPWYRWGFGGFGGWLMIIGMVIFWGLVIWGIVALVHRTSGNGYGTDHQHSESALEVLKRRYAKGEINKEEFEEKKKALI
jgi:putative membrane protein